MTNPTIFGTIPSGGAFLSAATALSCYMDMNIERIIRRVLEEARGKGRDHLTQTEEAVRAVCQARPDRSLSGSEALPRAVGTMAMRYIIHKSGWLMFKSKVATGP